MNHPRSCNYDSVCSAYQGELSIALRRSPTISKHSARRELTLPWPSGISLPTMNFPSALILSMDASCHS